MSDYYGENARKCAGSITDIGTKSTNLCVILRRKAKYKNLCFLPDEAFYPDGVPVEPPIETRRNSQPRTVLSDKPENVRRRERYANDREYRESQKGRTRKNYYSTAVPRP